MWGKFQQNCHFSAKYGALGRMATSLLSFRTFLLVAATSILAVTERDDATITKKNKYLLLRATEEAAATITVGATFFF